MRVVECAGWGHPAFRRSSQSPVPRGQRSTPEALKRVARGREAHPGKRKNGSPTLEGLQQRGGRFAPPSGCVLVKTREPRVGEVAPTRGYRLQRLRRNGGHAGHGFRRVGAPGLQSGNRQLPFHPPPDVVGYLSRSGNWELATPPHFTGPSDVPGNRDGVSGTRAIFPSTRVGQAGRVRRRDGPPLRRRSR